MYMRASKFLLLAAVAVVLGACEKQDFSNKDLQGPSANKLGPAGKSADLNAKYLVIASSNTLPGGLAGSIADAGGELVTSISEIGVAVAVSSDGSFMKNASKIKGIKDVVPDPEIRLIDPVMPFYELTAEASSPPLTGDDDFYFDYQWGHTAIEATEAWEEGYRGAGVRVGVIDGGFDLDHPDLEPNINLGLSKDFTGEGLQYVFGDAFSHGSHTAGTIAAADNAFGTIGVAPEAELVLIKVLSDTTGSGSSSDVMQGIIYAASVDCDVINLSLGAVVYKSAYGFDVPASYIAAYKNAYNRAVNYAYQMGTTVVAAAGNDGVDFDHAADLVHLPSGASNALSVSATGPIGWIFDYTTDLDVLAPYSNYGQKVIDFAAPGGLYELFDSPGWQYDMVFSTGNGGWYWSAGTSMAAPHVTGVAALIIGKNGGSMSPAQVKAVLKASSDDLGKPGKDDAYGYGRVNAYRAVTN